jgi:hypothetical protein
VARIGDDGGHGGQGLQAVLVDVLEFGRIGGMLGADAQGVEDRIAAGDVMVRRDRRQTHDPVVVERHRR